MRDWKRAEEMAQLRLMGWTLQKIGATYGLSRQRVQVILKQFGNKQVAAPVTPIMGESSPVSK